jgi:hypothetical protein
MKTPLLSLEITRFEKTGGPLTKRVYVKPHGAIANDSSDCRMSRGVMHRQHLDDLRALAGLIANIGRKTTSPKLPVAALAAKVARCSLNS